MDFFNTNNKLLQETMAKTQAYNKEVFDKKRRGELILNPGDQVRLSTKNLKLACPLKKMGPKFVGPFPVKRWINDVDKKMQI